MQPKNTLFAILFLSAGALAQTVEIPIADSTGGRKIADAPGASKVAENQVSNELTTFKATSDSHKAAASNSILTLQGRSVQMDTRMKTGIEARVDNTVIDCYSCGATSQGVGNNAVLVNTNTVNTTDTYNESQAVACTAPFTGTVNQTQHVVYVNGLSTQNNNWQWASELCSEVTTYNTTLPCPPGQTGSITIPHTVTTWTPLSNKSPTDVAGADINSCVAVFIPPPPPGGGGGGGSFAFGGLGTVPGNAVQSNPNITNGSWTGTFTGPSTADVTFTGGVSGVPNLFSGVCLVTLTDIGGGNFDLNGCGGSGVATATGGITLNFSTPDLTGQFTGTWNASGASGAVTATVNAGINLYDVYNGAGGMIGIILMDGSGNFTGFGPGSSNISGFCCNGWITLGGGEYLAAIKAGSFGTLTTFSGTSYALGGAINNFFAVGSSGGIIGTGAIMDVASDDPAWVNYFSTHGLPAPPLGFDAILSITSLGSYVAGSSKPSGYIFSNGDSITTP